MPKSKHSITTIGLTMVLILLSSLFIQDIFKKPPVTSTLPTIFPIVASQRPIAVTTPISKPLSQTKTFPHELLPGFNITIPNSWYISGVKQFGEKDSVGFASEYASYGLPNENSMAVRVFKNGNFFDLIFDLIFDDSPKCSNEFIAIDIGNEWYRITDNKGKHFYSRSVTFNSSMIGSNKRYKVCIMSGYKISGEPSETIAPYGGALILENIKVYGNVNEDLLNEIDNIVRSIVL